MANNANIKSPKKPDFKTTRSLNWLGNESLLIGCKKNWTFINVQKKIVEEGSKCQKTCSLHNALKVVCKIIYC
jgi:hypothetical protein